MIDSANEVTCKYCGDTIVEKGGRGHRKRVYCNDAHKMKDRRHKQAEKQQAAATQAQAQIAALEKQVKELEKRLLAGQSVNERFRHDPQARYYAQTPFGQRFLDGRKNRILPPRGSRAMYESLLYHQLGHSTQAIDTLREACRHLLD